MNTIMGFNYYLNGFKLDYDLDEETIKKVMNEQAEYYLQEDDEDYDAWESEVRRELERLCE